MFTSRRPAAGVTRCAPQAPGVSPRLVGPVSAIHRIPPGGALRHFSTPITAALLAAR